MKPYREPTQRGIERAPEELRKELIQWALPLTRPKQLSPILTSYPRDIFRTKETGFPKDALGHFDDLNSNLTVLASDYPEDDLLPSDIKKKLADAKEQLIIKLSAEFGLSLKELRDNFFGYRWIQNGKYFTCIGPVMRYIEDNYYSFRHYLDTGEMPTAERMAEERHFQARKMLVELMGLFKPLVPADQMTDEADSLICEIKVLLANDLTHEDNPQKECKKLIFRGNSVGKNGDINELLSLMEKAILHMDSSDSGFLSAECRDKLERSKLIIKERRSLRGTEDQFKYGQPKGLFWDTFNNGRRMDMSTYTTGFMPVLDWFLAHEKELKAEYANRESTFYTPPSTKVGVAQSIRQRFLPF